MKHILLIFLSPVKLNADKSVSETSYANLLGEPTRTTNESAVRYVLQSGTALDKIFIFASKVVREAAAVNGQTSLQYFTERLARFTNATAEIYPYDETSSGTENLKSVAEMAGLIQNFAQDNAVTLHVDLTGGMRHINMIMLDVIRLLEYSGIKIGKLIYSNFQTRRVEEINGIYDLFQLISGVEEFVQFGSVKALEKYYEGKTLSPALKRLVDAMKVFADEIKLCHYGQLKTAIENLHDAVHDFEAGSADEQDLLMARLIGRIRRDYQSLIENRERDDLRVIRWCIENGYLQQALTLYTERVPEYLCQKNFFSVSPDEKPRISKELSENRIDKLGFGFYLLNNYRETAEEFNGLSRALLQEIDRLHRPYFNLVKEEAFGAIKQGKFDYDSWRQKLHALLEETCAKFQIEQGDVICEDEPLLLAQLEVLIALKENPQLLADLDAPFFEPFRKFFAYKDGKFRAELETITDISKRYAKFTELVKQRNDIAKKYIPNIKPRKYPQTYRLIEMSRAGIFTANIPAEIFFSIMNKYFRVKIERNLSNHARADLSEFPTADALRNFIAAGLDEIEGAKNLCAESS